MDIETAKAILLSGASDPQFGEAYDVLNDYLLEHPNPDSPVGPFLSNTLRQPLL